MVVDKEMSKYHGDDLQRYVLTLMSIVSEVLLYCFLGNLKFDLLILNTGQFVEWYEIYCSWLKELKL